VNATVVVTVTATPLTPGLTITNLTTAVTGPLATSVTTTTFVEPLPLLAVRFNPPTTVQLSWPSSLSNFTLQFIPSLPGTNWSDVLTVPVSSGGTNTVTHTNLGAAMFYRLKR